MAAVEIGYGGGLISTLDSRGTKTLKTAGTYCERDIVVAYTPRSRSYELTLAKASGWVLLTTLDEDVLAHINDPELVVSLMNISGYAYEFYGISMVVASNTAQNMQGKYPQYGIGVRQNNETTAPAMQMYFPPNKTTTENTVGGVEFRIDGDKYYFKPADGFIRSGTYRLTFQW